MTVTNVQSTYDSINTKSSTTAATTAADASDRFLKLLVAQMQNQDPLSPMDNAQVTSQMAQINTVTGVEKLNTTVQGLNTQMVQMQALQGASLIGNSVVVPSNKMTVTDGKGEAGFSIGSAADAVKVEVLNAAGYVVDTMNLGAQGAGTHSFEWDAGKNADLKGMTFRVTATSGTNKIDSTALVEDKVTSVSVANGSLVLDLANTGSVPYDQVKSFN